MVEATSEDVTDDSSLLERLQVPVTVVEGSARNIKITTAEDLLMAEALLKSEIRDQKSEDGDHGVSGERSEIKPLTSDL